MTEVRFHKNEKARHMGGLGDKRCRLLLASARSCQTSEAEAEKREGAGFGYSSLQLKVSAEEAIPNTGAFLRTHELQS